MGDRIETRATWIIYEGAGRPLVLDAKREPVRTHPAKPCGRCDDPQGVYRFADVVSDNFIPTSNASVMLVARLSDACLMLVQGPLYDSALYDMFMRVQ